MKTGPSAAYFRITSKLWWSYWKLWQIQIDEVQPNSSLFPFLFLVNRPEYLRQVPIFFFITWPKFKLCLSEQLIENCFPRSLCRHLFFKQRCHSAPHSTRDSLFLLPVTVDVCQMTTKQIRHEFVNFAEKNKIRRFTSCATAHRISVYINFSLSVCSIAENCYRLPRLELKSNTVVDPSSSTNSFLKGYK